MRAYASMCVHLRVLARVCWRASVCACTYVSAHARVLRRDLTSAHIFSIYKMCLINFMYDHYAPIKYEPLIFSHAVCWRTSECAYASVYASGYVCALQRISVCVHYHASA